MPTQTKSPLYTSIHCTVLKFIHSHHTARTQGASALNAACAHNCKRFYSPISLQALLPPAFASGESNEHYAARMQIELEQTRHSREAEIRRVFIDEGERKAAANVVFYSESVKTGKEYAFEFAYFFDLDEAGEMIERVQVFADPGMAKRFFEENEEIGDSVKE